MKSIVLSLLLLSQNAVLASELQNTNMSFAINICTTFEECKILSDSAKEEIRIVQLGKNELYDFMRYHSVTNRQNIGDILFGYPQDSAISYCDIRGDSLLTAEDRLRTPGGMHLPTAREVALMASKYNASIIEKSDINDKKCRDFEECDYDLIEVVNVINPSKRDVFYYSSRKYKRPLGELGDHRIWTSSRNNENEPIAFNSTTGKFESEHGKYKNFITIRCAPGKK